MTGRLLEAYLQWAADCELPSPKTIPGKGPATPGTTPQPGFTPTGLEHLGSVHNR